MDQSPYVGEPVEVMPQGYSGTNPILLHGGKEAAMLISAAIAVAIILSAVTKLVEVTLRKK